MPILWFCGIEITEAVMMSASLGACLFEPVLSGVICEGMNLSTTAQWIITVVPYASIIFFAGFIPSLWKSRINCGIGEVLIVWFERMILGILITSIIVRGMISLGIIG